MFHDVDSCRQTIATEFSVGTLGNAVADHAIVVMVLQSGFKFQPGSMARLVLPTGYVVGENHTYCLCCCQIKRLGL